MLHSHVKELEQRSTLLEQVMADLAETNRRFDECRHMVDALRSENQRLSAENQRLSAALSATGGGFPSPHQPQPLDPSLTTTSSTSTTAPPTTSSEPATSSANAEKTTAVEKEADKRTDARNNDNADADADADAGASAPEAPIMDAKMNEYMAAALRGEMPSRYYTRAEHKT